MELEGQEPITDDPEDYAAVVELSVGRIYRNHVDRKTWMWFLQSPIGASGYAGDLDEAKAALKKRWTLETAKLRRDAREADVDQSSQGVSKTSGG